MDHLDYETLETLKQVMEGEFGLLVSTFKQDSTERIASLRNLIQQEDTDLVRRAAHSFKGSSSNIGAQRLSTLCAALEKKALAGSLQGALIDLQEIEQEFLAVQAQLEEFYARN